MGDLFNGPITWFDFLVVAIIVVSAVMSLGRGLVREATSVISFVAGGATALIVNQVGQEPLANIMPDSWGPTTPSIVLVVVGFLAAYALAAWIGGRLAHVIHTSPEIGVLDRLGGGAFGIARGILASVLFVLLMQQVLPRDGRPPDIVRARTYGYLDGAANWIRAVVPGFLKEAVDTDVRKPEPKPSGAPAVTAKKKTDA